MIRHIDRIQGCLSLEQTLGIPKHPAGPLNNGQTARALFLSLLRWGLDSEQACLLACSNLRPSDPN